jgi:hypothetical protein
MLKIPVHIYQQLEIYAEAVPGEIGGLGYVTVDDKGDFTVQKVWLLEQEASGSETDLDASSIAKLIDELINAGESTAFNFWWHSHGGMGAFWSTTDNKTMESWTGDWLLSLVINKKMEMKSKLITFIPIPLSSDIDTKVVYNDCFEKELYLAEVKRKVRESPARNYGTALVKKGGNWEPYHPPAQREYIGTSINKTNLKWYCGEEDKCKTKGCKEPPLYECDNIEVLADFIDEDDTEKKLDELEERIYAEGGDDLTEKEWDEYLELMGYSVISY